MTERLRLLKKPVTAGRLLCGLLVLPLLLLGCTKDEATDYCKNHYRFHAQHIDSLASLLIELGPEGELSSELVLPLAAIDSNPAELEGLMAVLEDPGQVYSIQSLQSCDPPTVNFGNRTLPDGSSLVVQYQSECGSENQIKQVDINLFEVLPELDEVETNVFTPATTKRFAISRQCDAAIFRLDPREEDE